AKQVSEQEYIASLQRQVQELTQVIDAIERHGKDRDDDDPSAPAHQVSGVGSGTRSHPRSPANDGIRDPTSRTTTPLPTVHGRDDNDAYLRNPSPSQMGNAARPVNAMGASMAVQTESPDTPSHDGVYYGPSSVHSLLQHLPRPSPATITPAGDTQHHPLPRPQGRRMYPQERVDSLLQPEYALPPRSMANALLHLYLDNIHVFYPWVHSPSFCSRFEALWEPDGLHDVTATPSAGDVGLGGSKCPPRTFYCAVNAMFALGCEFSDFPDNQAASATFYRRVRRLLDSDILDSSSVSLVQVLLLVSHYLLTTQYPTRCYNMIGLACRMAVGLGLHLDKPGSGRMEAETQMRRRLWHGCVQMET
ncbi:fungal specific transcription factor domain-containing protein, partial [Colletotrichum musicola]